MIVQHRDDARHRDNLRCINCGEALWCPYMIWSGAQDIAVCSGCCVSQGESLMADIVHLAAIHNMRRLIPAHDYTLERVTINSIREREARAEEEQQRRILKEVDREEDS
jgi:hypothetical protein